MGSHHDILDAVRDLIASGTWQAGSRLPAERDLSDRFGVALNTVRKALDSLESDGVLRDTFLHTRAAGDLGGGTPSLALALLEAGGEAVHPRTLASVEQAESAAIVTQADTAGWPRSGRRCSPTGPSCW